MVVQAIEFWSVLAEIELLLKEDEDFNGVTSSTESECKRFLEHCAEQLVPKLLELLLLQNEDQDDEDTEWCATSHSILVLGNAWRPLLSQQPRKSLEILS